MSTTVTYKGNTLTTVSNNTKTLKTAGKYMEGDVVLTDVSASANVWQDANGYIYLSPEGAPSTNEDVLYVYSDLNGEGVVNTNGYGFVSCDFAPVKDNKFRYWIDLDSSDLTFNPNVTVPTYSSYRFTGRIDWGDGTPQTDYTYGNTDHTHTYSSPGRYCVSIWWTGGSDRFVLNDVSNIHVNKVVAIEFYMKNYPENGLMNYPKVRKLRYSSQQTTVMFPTLSSLVDVVLPSSVTTIGQCYNCKSLKKLIIPESVTSIVASAFSGNSAMEEYHFLPTTPPTLGNSNVFSGIPSNCVIYVPSASLSAYQQASIWSDYANYMQGE